MFSSYFLVPFGSLPSLRQTEAAKVSKRACQRYRRTYTTDARVLHYERIRTRHTVPVRARPSPILGRKEEKTDKNASTECPCSQGRPPRLIAPESAREPEPYHISRSRGCLLLASGVTHLESILGSIGPKRLRSPPPPSHTHHSGRLLLEMIRFRPVQSLVFCVCPVM